jgi:hypothetical protein
MKSINTNLIMQYVYVHGRCELRLSFDARPMASAAVVDTVRLYDQG